MSFSRIQLILCLIFLLASCGSQNKYHKELTDNLESNPRIIFPCERVGIEHSIIIENKGLVDALAYSARVVITGGTIYNDRIKKHPETGLYLKIDDEYSGQIYLQPAGDYPATEQWYNVEIIEAVNVEKIHPIDEENLSIKVEITITPTELGREYYKIRDDAIYTVENKLTKLKGGEYEIGDFYFNPDIKAQTNVEYLDK